MAKLENLKQGALISGISSTAPVHIVSCEWIGSQAVNVIYRHPNDGIGEVTLYREDEHRLDATSQGLPWSLSADGAALRLVTEACRIKQAHFFDPYLAIHTSLIDPLPHQISAVYGEMLPRQPLRYLLADDPGAGKTIMAGLLMKELQARSDLQRCLIVAPGSLVEQWQDELDEKFSLPYEILSRDMINSSRTGNPFSEHNHLIVRLDALARSEELLEKLEAAPEWDMIICDEAHRMSASYFGGEVNFTKRYKAGQALGRCCRHFLLMSATPHNGKEEDFQLFMALLDGDRFEGRFRDGVHVADTQDMMRRLTKEELLRFDGRPLFPERRAYTVQYDLSDEEAALYTAVSEYVREEMNRVLRFAETDGKKRNNVGFALQILQRRLASSPAAIYQSLKRRRERLEHELEEHRLAVRSRNAWGETSLSTEVMDNLEELAQNDLDDIEERIVTGATTAETIEQLAIEIDTLKVLEQQALALRRSGEDTKWRQLDRILDDDLMIDSDGNRRKLIIFTESKDTLEYLVERIRNRLGRSEAVAFIHGGVTREDRRKTVARYMQDRELLVLVANDAAGEGVNLQRGHLMVNYDLPWNPNKLEQRFGRIHRIGQTEVCHLWNLVAHQTREGAVYARLLEKLETAREALGGRVYDVLGQLFEGHGLRELLVEAIQYGEQPEVRNRLMESVEGAVDTAKLHDLLAKRAINNDSLPEARVQALKQEMERAHAERLQPHHIQSFFISAFSQLGGRLKQREPGRFEISHVPSRLRERDRQIGTGVPLARSIERICFDKSHVHQQPIADFVCPGHPLLEATLSLVREDHEHLMQQGAVMVDDNDDGGDIKAVFLFEHAIRDGRSHENGDPHLVSQKLQFVALDQYGNAADAGSAPHLNLRAASEDEIKALQGALSADWLKNNLEQAAKNYATGTLAFEHLKEVRDRRLPEIDRVKTEVVARLKKEINHWDHRAIELREQEKAGRKTGLSAANAARRAEDLSERLKTRLGNLERERQINAQPPQIRGGMVVVPKGALPSPGGHNLADGDVPRYAPSAEARRRVELLAMQAVTDSEKALGNQPEDVSAQNKGYDIASYSPATGHQRFIEVKGRVVGATTVTLTRQEIITSLHAPDKYILALVEVDNRQASTPKYVFGALADHEPGFEQTSVNYQLDRLYKRAGEPS